jgi:hypothetical protein
MLLEVAMTTLARRSQLFAIIVFLLMAASPTRAQERQSSALVGDLASLMTARQLEAIAAQDPDSPDRFVAALLMPDVQLLIVSAQYPAPAELQAQLAQRQYRDVYTALLVWKQRRSKGKGRAV